MANIIKVGFVSAALVLSSVAFAHMPDRHDLDPWFSTLRSKGGALCCSLVDGVAITTDAWDNNGTVDLQNSGYRVYVEGAWREVPKAAVIEEPNRYGQAMYWPSYEWQSGNEHGKVVSIRCFIPGAGT